MEIQPEVQRENQLDKEEAIATAMPEREEAVAKAEDGLDSPEREEVVAPISAEDKQQQTRQLIRLYSQIERRDRALEYSAASVSQQTHPDLFDESGKKLTLAGCKASPGTSRQNTFHLPNKNQIYL